MRYNDIKAMASFWNVRTGEIAQRTDYFSTVKREMLTQDTCLKRSVCI